MKKKKIIGTVIGVIFFVALIAGATYAWLTFNINVTNGTYNGTTGNFLIDYVGGGEITSVPVVSSGTPESSAVKEITAKLATNSVPGKLTIKLTTNSTTLITTSGVINYAVCTSSTTTSSCTNNFNNAVSTGTISASGEKVLYADTTDLTNTNKHYFVYFWIDGSQITNEMLADGQNSYSGYISASAEQSH